MGEALITRRGNKEGTIYNVFCQPTQPVIKRGIWLKTQSTVAYKKIVFDTNPWTAGSWKLSTGIPNAPTSNLYTFAVVGDILYGFRSNSLYKFNISTNTWLNKITAPLSINSMVASGTLFYAYRVNDNDFHALYTYNVSTGVWSQCSGPGWYNDNAALEMYENELYAFGGGTATFDYANRAQKYNLSTNTWTALPKIPISDDASVSGLTATRFANNIFLGGYSKRNFNLIKYNPASSSYEVLNGAPYRSSSQCVIVVGDEIYFLSGSNVKCYAYKPNNNTWRNLPDAPMQMSGSTPVIYKNMIYVNGNQLSMNVFSLIAKQYPVNPTSVIYYLPGDQSHFTSLVSGKMCDYMPIYFKDALLFQNGNLARPELYYGNGSSWVKIRDIQ